MYSIGKNSAKKWFRFVLFLILGICINLIFNTIANRCLDKIMYLDTVGTMLVAIIGGYFPGIFVALASNLICGIFDNTTLNFVLLNILIALFTSFFYNKFHNENKKYFIFFNQYIIVVSVCASIFGTIITYAQGHTAPHDAGLIDCLVLFIMNQLHCNFLAGHFISNLLVNLVDKSICLLIACFLVKIMPKNVIKDIRDVAWYQKPLNEEQLKKINANTARRMPIKGKIVISLVTACLSITVVVAFMSRALFISYMQEKYYHEAKGVSRLAAHAIDPENVSDYIKSGESFPGYLKTENLLYSVSVVTTNIQYIFVYQINDDGYTVVFDLDTDDVEGERPGTFVEFDKSVLPYVDALKAGEEIEPFITDDEKIGYFLTSLSPVYDENGNCVCYAGVDITMGDLEDYERKFMLRLFSLCAGFMIMIISAGIWFAKYHIIYPINTLVKVTDGFDYVGENSRKQNIESLREVGIHTGDEVENLYYTLLQTLEENMVNYSYVLQKSKDLDEVQSGLIMILADLVENRDSSTGDHIRKTATYTGIIMRKMRQMGYYTDVLTDEYIDTVMKSAPLHDIGKIQISDTILNKPGKLTDEEFEKMKKHTIYGAKVIDQCIVTLPNANYLTEAKNVAAFHHEKWNGSGYPFGLSGEGIPLSARVMAVADVFDALVSIRVYKKAYSFEAAMDIIAKEAGTHFDPKVVEAFIAAEDEVRAAAEHFENNK